MLLGQRSVGVFIARATLAGVCMLLGALPLLAAFGLVRGSPVEPLAIPFVLLFGLIFIALGVAALFHPFRDLAESRGAHSLRDARRLAVRAFLARPNRASVTAALSLAPLAVVYLVTAAGGAVPWFGESLLIAVFTLEFLTIHAFPFVVIFGAAFSGADNRTTRVVAGVMLALVAVPYGFMAWVTAGGVEGLAWLVYLLVPNVLATVSRRSDRNSRILAVCRWATKTGALVTLAAMLSSGDLGGPGTLVLAGVYFTVMVFVEAYRVVEIPLDLATTWAAESPSATESGSRPAGPGGTAPTR